MTEFWMTWREILSETTSNPIWSPEQWNPPCCTNSLMKQWSVLPLCHLAYWVIPGPGVPEGTVVGAYPSRSRQIVTLKNRSKSWICHDFLASEFTLFHLLGWCYKLTWIQKPEILATWFRPCKPSSVTPKGWTSEVILPYGRPHQPSTSLVGGWVTHPYVILCVCIWLVVLTILKKISQWEGLSHILWKIKNVPSHQPGQISTSMYLFMYIYIYICDVVIRKHHPTHNWTLENSYVETISLWTHLTNTPKSNAALFLVGRMPQK